MTIIFHGGCFMENTKLFQVGANGYNCTQVDEYIRILKEEYKKVYDYAKAKDDLIAKANEKLVAMQKEKEALRASGVQLEERIKQLEAQLAQKASAPAAAAQEPQDNAVLLRSISTMTMLSEEIVRENRELRKRVEALENK